MADITPEEYAKLLRQRGLEKAEKYREIVTLDGEIEPNSNLVYMRDFDLGDLCTYKSSDTGLMEEARITEIVETYENANSTVTIKFGDGNVSSIKDLIKREVN